jgi:hypothetical protein
MQAKTSCCSDTIWFFSQKFFMLPVRHPDNNAGANVDSAIYTHIISISKLLSSHTLAVFRGQ